RVTASRTTLRLTPCSSDTSRSERREPGSISPSRIFGRIEEYTLRARVFSSAAGCTSAGLLSRGKTIYTHKIAQGARQGWKIAGRGVGVGWQVALPRFCTCFELTIIV